MGLLSNEPRIAIFWLCSLFNELCQKVIDKNILESLEANVAETLCMFGRYFPPCFFDVVVHLTIHLSREALIGGPAQFSWIYPFERYMKVLKGYVKNHARPEGCMTKRYAAEECSRHCSGYIKEAAEMGVRHTAEMRILNLE